MIVRDVIAAMEQIAPPELAESWDNVGLLVGSADWPVERLLLTIDLTEAVLDEAIRTGASMIIAYHPPIFDPLRSITDGEVKQRIILNAIRHSIAIYTPHTALDAATDGVNDWLADALGQGDRRALAAHPELPASEEMKVVTFCPADTVERVRHALASVGAGKIGDYEQCSFEIVGEGTFFGTESTNPAVGEAERFERVPEVRLEMVCPRRSLALAVTAIRQFHPYEEPAIEIYALQPRPMRAVGQGRRVVLDTPVPLSTILLRLKRKLGLKRLRVAKASATPKKYDTLGVCAGSGGSLLDSAVNQGCEVFLTGEMRHHDVLSATGRGCCVILAGHTNTERGYLPILRDRLAGLLGELPMDFSASDVDPLRLS